jgi:ABC-2 type transport system permease protein
VVVVPAAGVAAAERTATEAVVRKERQGVLVLDSLTLTGKQARYAGRNASSFGDVERIRDVVRREVLVVRLAREGLSADRVSALTGPRLRLATLRITDAGQGGSGAGGAIVATVVAVLLYMMILLYGQNVMRSVLEEKTTAGGRGGDLEHPPRRSSWPARCWASAPSGCCSRSSGSGGPRSSA